MLMKYFFEGFPEQSNSASLVVASFSWLSVSSRSPRSCSSLICSISRSCSSAPSRYCSAEDSSASFDRSVSDGGISSTFNERTTCGLPSHLVFDEKRTPSSSKILFFDGF